MIDLPPAPKVGRLQTNDPKIWNTDPEQATHQWDCARMRKRLLFVFGDEAGAEPRLFKDRTGRWTAYYHSDRTNRLVYWTGRKPANFP